MKNRFVQRAGPNPFPRRRLVGLAAVALAACGSSATTATSSTPTSPASPSAATSEAVTPSSSSATSTAAVVGAALAAPTNAAVVVRETNEFLFVSNSVTVKIGDVVEWTNTGGIQHNVVFLDQPSLSSPLMNKGDSWGARFTSPGTFRYVCQPHREQGMTGTVTVTG